MHLLQLSACIPCHTTLFTFAGRCCCQQRRQCLIPNCAMLCVNAHPVYACVADGLGNCWAARAHKDSKLRLFCCACACAGLRRNRGSELAQLARRSSMLDVRACMLLHSGASSFQQASNSCHPCLSARFAVSTTGAVRTLQACGNVKRFSRCTQRTGDPEVQCECNSAVEV